MKLDRNINPDGRGKYALINLRTNQVLWGGDDQFFVIKYKDRFASAALKSYAEAVINHAHYLSECANKQFEEMTADGKVVMAHLLSRQSEKVVADLLEYGSEIMRESEAAEKWPTKKLPD